MASGGQLGGAVFWDRPPSLYQRFGRGVDVAQLLEAASGIPWNFRRIPGLGRRFCDGPI